MVTLSIAAVLLLGAVGSAASLRSTHRLRAMYAGFWNDDFKHRNHPAMPPLAGLAVWLGISVGGLLGPALVSGSPRVSFDPSPGWGVVLMLAGLSLLGAVAWVLFNPRLFVALVCGGIGEHARSRTTRLNLGFVAHTQHAGLFGGGLIATQAEGQHAVGIGLALMIGQTRNETFCDRKDTLIRRI